MERDEVQGPLTLEAARERLGRLDADAQEIYQQTHAYVCRQLDREDITAADAKACVEMFILVSEFARDGTALVIESA